MRAASDTHSKTVQLYQPGVVSQLFGECLCTQEGRRRVKLSGATISGENVWYERNRVPTVFPMIRIGLARVLLKGPS